MVGKLARRGGRLHCNLLKRVAGLARGGGLRKQKGRPILSSPSLRSLVSSREPRQETSSSALARHGLARRALVMRPSRNGETIRCCLVLRVRRDGERGARSSSDEMRYVNARDGWMPSALARCEEAGLLVCRLPLPSQALAHWPCTALVHTCTLCKQTDKLQARRTGAGTMPSACLPSAEASEQAKASQAAAACCRPTNKQLRIRKRECEWKAERGGQASSLRSAGCV